LESIFSKDILTELLVDPYNDLLKSHLHKVLSQD
jgi:hypothetical protein